MNDKISTAKVCHFIENGLKDRLIEDMLDLKLLTEGDLQVRAYYHLWNFLKNDSKSQWRITNQLHTLGKRGKRNLFPYYPDMILMKGIRKSTSRVAIELKENNRVSEKAIRHDEKKLHRLWERDSPERKRKPLIKMGYLIHIFHGYKRIKESEQQQKVENWIASDHKDHIRPIIINAKDHFPSSDLYDEWNSKRHRFTDLLVGKRFREP